MRIKVGSTWYDGERVPIMVELTKKDKENIRDMPTQAKKYCQYPDSFTPKEIKEWMK